MADRNATLFLLVTANHILSHYGIIDGFGHVSVRSPEDPNTFYVTGGTPPAFVSTAADLAHCNVSDAAPVTPGSGGTSPWSERFNHSEVYKRYPGVMSVVHSHSNAVIAQGVSGRPIKPMFHMAGFLGEQVPVFDIADCYEEGDAQNILVNKVKFGTALAGALSAAPIKDGQDPLPDYTVALQRSHGFTTWGSGSHGLQEAVYRAVYTQENAKIQMDALALRSFAAAQPGTGVMRPLTGQEVPDCATMDRASVLKAWAYWSRVVEALPLYKNEIKRDTKGERAYGDVTTRMYK